MKTYTRRKRPAEADAVCVPAKRVALKPPSLANVSDLARLAGQTAINADPYAFDNEADAQHGQVPTSLSNPLSAVGAITSPGRAGGLGRAEGQCAGANSGRALPISLQEPGMLVRKLGPAASDGVLDDALADGLSAGCARQAAWVCEPEDGEGEAQGSQHDPDFLRCLVELHGSQDAHARGSLTRRASLAADALDRAASGSQDALLQGPASDGVERTLATGPGKTLRVASGSQEALDAALGKTVRASGNQDAQPGGSLETGTLAAVQLQAIRTVSGSQDVLPRGSASGVVERAPAEGHDKALRTASGSQDEELQGGIRGAAAGAASQAKGGAGRPPGKTPKLPNAGSEPFSQGCAENRLSGPLAAPKRDARRVRLGSLSCMIPCSRALLHTSLCALFSCSVNITASLPCHSHATAENPCLGLLCCHLWRPRPATWSACPEGRRTLHDMNAGESCMPRRRGKPACLPVCKQWRGHACCPAGCREEATGTAVALGPHRLANAAPAAGCARCARHHSHGGMSGKKVQVEL